jgi:prohibitin 2
MNWIWLVVALVVIAGAGWLIWRFGTRVVVTERQGEIVTMRKLRLSPTLVIIISAALVILAIFSTVRVVPVGHVMVKFNVVSKKYEVSGEGVAFLPPLIYNVYIYDMRRQDYTMSSASEGQKKPPRADETLWSPTMEGLSVGIDLTIWYRLNPDQIVQIHKTLGPDYEEKVIKPACRSVTRHVISKYSIMEVYSARRKAIEDEIFGTLKGLLEKDGFIIEGVMLRDVHFPPDFSKSIEQKQIAQQDAERMSYILEKEQKEAERKKIEAQGTAEAIRIVSAELKRNPEYITYMYVDKLSDDVQVIISDQGTILNLGELKQKGLK